MDYIEKTLNLLSYSYCSCNGKLKFRGKLPEGFMDIWNELSTETLFKYISKRTGGKCTVSRSVQFIE